MALPRYYDIEILCRKSWPIDDLVAEVRKNSKIQSDFEFANSLYPFYKDITFKFVDANEKLGMDHISAVMKDDQNYGYLYALCDHSGKMMNAVTFDYFSFPFIHGRECVLAKIQSMAKNFHTRNSQKFDATCLYLLYFYTLLLNQSLTWTCVDYIANGNKYHQMQTHLRGRMLDEKVNEM